MTSFAVPKGSLGRWDDRARQQGISTDKIATRFGEELLGLRDPEQGDDRDHVGEGVDPDGARGADQLHQNAAHPGTDEDGDREAGGRLVVGLHDVALAHQGREVGEVGDVEDDVADPDAEADGEELSQSQHAQGEGHRDRGQRDRTSAVSQDHQRPAADPVGQHPDEEGHEGEGEPLDRDEQPDHERAGVKLQDRQGRQGEGGDLAADDADGLSRPELEEVSVPPEAASAQHRR